MADEAGGMTDGSGGGGAHDGEAPRASAAAESSSAVSLPVPFFVQTTDLNCGPTALRMALSFLSDADDYDLPLIEAAVGIQDGKAVSTIRLAIAAAKLGFPAAFRSTSLFFNEAHLDNPYYQRFGDLDLEESKVLVAEAEAVGVDLAERSLSLAEVTASVGRDALAIALLDMNIVYGEEGGGYLGHFVPVVGFEPDGSAVLVHNQARERPASFMRVSAEVFDRARHATGTDEDLVLLRRPGSDAPAAGTRGDGGDGGDGDGGAGGGVDAGTHGAASEGAPVAAAAL
mmetsp:Transcript_10/g.32  ORF Transcript_10/g.32 Transcript_10/m.32 type:complete len:286 (-) Transcript_10:19-876(-)